ncbi:MAG: glycerophosphodiester phosphodiesterase [Chitinophagaceae bacterium]|nr:MAG: glycerophosphodiester phosphodiesterase [Chitinophagaceae bacterium]
MRDFLKKTAALLLLTLTLGACRRTYEVTQPDTSWDLFQSASALRIPGSAGTRLEGVYTISDGTELFGSDAVLKASYVASGTDTTFYVSLFCEKDVSYLVLEGRRIDSTILLNGQWRRMAGTQTGAVRLSIRDSLGGRFALSGASRGNTIIEGVYGEGNEVPGRALRLQYNRELYAARPLELVAHRGGGQTANLLPASENSAEIIPYAARFGATGIEIDVRLTSDGVPILYHDAALSERLIQKTGLVGPIENYSFAQLDGLVRLVRNGEHIPTLRQALETVVRKTPLRFVWLDMKFHGDLTLIRSMQQEYMQLAASLGKPLEILIGIPDQDVFDHFRQLPNYTQVPSVCELDPSDVSSVNARVWGPRWTLGLQNDEVAAMHAQGRRAFVWTLNLPQNIDLFLHQGYFDGILTDYPTAVAYAYYTQL